MGRTMWGAAFLTVSSLLLLPAHTYAAPSLSGDDLDVFRETEDWQLGPGTQQGPPLSLAKKVYLRAFLKEVLVIFPFCDRYQRAVAVDTKNSCKLLKLKIMKIRMQYRICITY